MDKYLKIQEKIRCSEIAYLSCFTERYENEQIIRYRDSQLKDMHFHNFTYIKKPVSKEVFQQIIKEEIQLNYQENKDFCRFALDEMPNEKYLKGSHWEQGIEHYGNYVYVPMKSPKWNTLNGYQIRKITDSSMVEDLVLMDLIHEGEILGKDFCNRRARRLGQVYLSEMPVDSYICYLDKLPVGNCDLFLNNGIAKIENFTVLSEYQRKGVGTTILKYIIDTALSNGAEMIYLTADEYDTPKEMYKKFGFAKVRDLFILICKL